LKRRVSWKKFIILVAMSIFGLWASTNVLVVYYTLHQNLTFCPPPQTGWFGIRVDCGAVLSSPYSSIFGVPLEILGVGYFLVALGLICLVSFGPRSNTTQLTPDTLCLEVLRAHYSAVPALR
jgi:uncharacterized membrane protein